MHRTRYAFLFFFVNMTKESLERYTKRVYNVKDITKKIVRKHKICLILWRVQCKKNAPDRGDR